MSLRKWPTCRKCGSDLTTRTKTIVNAAGVTVDIYKCRCGGSKRAPRRTQQ